LSVSEAKTDPCFSISLVNVEASLLSRQLLDPVLTPYRNKCIGLADINVLLKELTNLYMDAGYITSRVYVPEQDIAGTKVLRLVAAAVTTVHEPFSIARSLSNQPPR